MRCDINCDLGEGFGTWTHGDDTALLAVVTSANIACGFHAGDPSIMRATCERAVAHGVSIGAHIGYHDLAGFGRREIAVAPADLRDEALYQIGALDAIAGAAGGTVRYVKPHGALYHSAARDEAVADAIAAAVTAYHRELVILGPANSRLHQAATAAGIGFRAEGFADRAYLGTGGLAPRSNPTAVLGADAAVQQALALATTGRVATVDRGSIHIDVHSICVHSDSPGAVAIARRIRNSLEDNDIRVEAFA
jgi:5-oxoprolinase (ATP-hydrolysing) subunit A